MDCPLVEGGVFGDWNPLPRKIHRKNGRYFLVHKNKWHSLGRDKDSAKARLAELMKEMDIAIVDVDFLINLFWTAKKRAKYLEVEFTLTQDDVMAMWRNGNGKCAVTGIRLSEANPTGLKRRPWIPSLDRIDPRKGYTLENTRLVCFALNAAMNAWGAPVFDRLIAGYLANRGTTPPA